MLKFCQYLTVLSHVVPSYSQSTVCIHVILFRIIHIIILLGYVIIADCPAAATARRRPPQLGQERLQTPGLSKVLRGTPG